MLLRDWSVKTEMNGTPVKSANNCYKRSKLKKAALLARFKVATLCENATFSESLY